MAGAKSAKRQGRKNANGKLSSHYCRANGLPKFGFTNKFNSCAGQN